MNESPIYPDVREWSFTNHKTRETRRYEQAELTIDGEMQFFRLATDAMAELRDADFPFQRLGELFPEDDDLSSIDLRVVSEMLTIAASRAAGLMVRGAAIMLGLFEFDENGQRNKDYADEVKFLRGTIHTADVVEMVETFVQQNDVERLRAPFFRAWNAATATLPTPMPQVPQNGQGTSTEPSTSSSPAATESLVTSAASTRGEDSTEP